MRACLFLVPVILAAQTPPAAKAPAAAPKAATPAKSAAKAGTPTPSAAKAKAKAPVAAPAAAAGELVTDDQKTIYALGVNMGQSLARFDFSPAELELVKRGVADAAAGKPALKLEDWSSKIPTLMQARMTRTAAQEKIRGKAYQDKTALEPNTTRTPSGLIYRELATGTGASPKATDTVTVNYRGTLINGTEFDSSYKRGKPAEFPLNGVIACWTEGVQRMKAGGKSQLVCPSEIAYGDSGNPTIPGGATLIFEVELIAVKQ